MHIDHANSIADLRVLARSRLPRFVFDYLEGGADGEVALAGNIGAIRAIKLIPRVLRDVSKRDKSTTVFGETRPSPLIIAPTGINGLFWPDGDLALARAAAKIGAPFVLSTASSATIEDVARTDGELWFQLYVLSRALATSLVDRARNVGIKTLILTVDVPVSGRRLRDLRNGFRLPFRFSPRLALDLVTHPRWSLAAARSGPPKMANLETSEATDAASQAALLNRAMDASFNWDDLARLRDQWKERLLIKGVSHLDDAKRAIAMGCDAVILSNHGGRQLDASPAPISILHKAAKSLDAPVFIDSGFRCGEDVLKAMALGASGVLIGRAALYGLAAAGQPGADRSLAILLDELDRAMALSGCTNLLEAPEVMDSFQIG